MSTITVQASLVVSSGVRVSFFFIEELERVLRAGPDARIAALASYVVLLRLGNIQVRNFHDIFITSRKEFFRGISSVHHSYSPVTTILPCSPSLPSSPRCSCTCRAWPWGRPGWRSWRRLCSNFSHALLHGPSTVKNDMILNNCLTQRSCNLSLNNINGL